MGSKQGILTDIANGEFDEFLDQIIDTSKDRLEAVRKMNVAMAESGDPVRLVNLRPQYLTRYKAHFLRKEGDRAVVKLDRKAAGGKGQGRYYGSDLELRVPITSMEVL